MSDNEIIEDSLPLKPKRVILNIPEKEKKNYFATVNKEGIEMFSTGCQLLDCVLGGGWVLGRMSNIVGDKSSSKTLLAIEACVNFLAKYVNGQVFYLEAEAAFDLGYAEAIGMPIDSITFIDCEGDNTVEFVHEYLMNLTQETKVPTLFIVDSLDALSDRSEKEREIDKGTYA